MRVQMEAGSMRDDKILMAGCEIKIFWRSRDLLILTGGMRRDSFNIDEGMQAEKQINWGGMAGLS